MEQDPDSKPETDSVHLSGFGIQIRFRIRIRFRIWIRIRIDEIVNAPFTNSEHTLPNSNINNEDVLKNYQWFEKKTLVPDNIYP